ncbi:MAG: sigma-70 family RNA polymerase sigma factor [Planctomycetota bacterium JB042]
MDPRTRPTLLSRVRDLDDHDSWREFDERYRDLILGYGRRRGLQATDAEDVRQIVMLNLARGLRSFRYEPGKGRFRDYIGWTTRHAIADLVRSRQLGAPVESPSFAADDGDVDRERDLEWEKEWMLHHYRLAMRTVRRTADAKSVRVFERLLAGDNVEVVAEEMAMTADAVHKVKQRMRDRLKAAVATQLRDEEEGEISR